MTNKIFQEDLVSECCGRDYAVRLRLQDICGECGNDCELVSKETFENMNDLWRDDQNDLEADAIEMGEILYDEDSHNYTD